MNAMQKGIYMAEEEGWGGGGRTGEAHGPARHQIFSKIMIHISNGSRHIKNGCEPSACFAQLQYNEEVFLATELQVIQTMANRI